jgi:serine protease inhibitor
MMKLTKKLSLVENPNGLPLTACEFPYVGNKIAMTILLPDSGVHLSDVEKKLNGEVLSTLLTIGFSVKTNAFVPKFKLEFKTEV